MERRYKVEEVLSKTYAKEELEPTQRLLKGDNNTPLLFGGEWEEEKNCNSDFGGSWEVLEDREQLKNHLNEYYKNLFGKETV